MIAAEAGDERVGYGAVTVRKRIHEHGITMQK